MSDFINFLEYIIFQDMVLEGFCGLLICHSAANLTRLGILLVTSGLFDELVFSKLLSWSFSDDCLGTSVVSLMVIVPLFCSSLLNDV